jgi:hypothetical protein
MVFFLDGIIASIISCITGGSDNTGDNDLIIRHINYDAEYITYGADNEPQKSIQLHELEDKFMPSLRDYCINSKPPHAYFRSSYDDEPLNTFERYALLIICLIITD